MYIATKLPEEYVQVSVFTPFLDGIITKSDERLIVPKVQYIFRNDEWVAHRNWELKKLLEFYEHD